MKLKLNKLNNYLKKKPKLVKLPISGLLKPSDEYVERAHAEFRELEVERKSLIFEEICRFYGGDKKTFTGAEEFLHYLVLQMLYDLMNVNPDSPLASAELYSAFTDKFVPAARSNSKEVYPLDNQVRLVVMVELEIQRNQNLSVNRVCGILRSKYGPECYPKRARLNYSEFIQDPAIRSAADTYLGLLSELQRKRIEIENFLLDWHKTGSFLGNS